MSITITDPAGFSDPGTPPVLPTLGRNAYAFLNNLTPAALEQVQRGAFTVSNGFANTAYTSPSTGNVPGYLTGASPCQGYTPVRKVWNPQFDQYTQQDNDTLRGVLGVRGRFGGDWKWGNLLPVWPDQEHVGPEQCRDPISPELGDGRGG